MQFEFSDAEIASLDVQDGLLMLRFAAARVLIDAEGEAQWIPLQLQGTGVTAADPAVLAAAMGRVHTGQVVQAGQRMLTLPVPWQSNGPVVLELALAQGPWLKLHCQTLDLQQVAGAQAVGAFQC